VEGNTYEDCSSKESEMFIGNFEVRFRNEKQKQTKTQKKS
jgi:hypothetical protein